MDNDSIRATRHVVFTLAGLVSEIAFQDAKSTLAWRSLSSRYAP